MATLQSQKAIELLISPIIKFSLSSTEGGGRYIAGYANVAGVRDSQKDVVELEALAKAWDQWSKNPDFCILSLLHTNIPIAKVLFTPVLDSKGVPHKSGVDDKGLYVVAKLRDDVSISDEVWRKIESGEYKGFSIGGRNLDPQPLQLIEGQPAKPITNLELYEIGIVDDPANPDCLFTILKRDALKPLNDLTKKIESGSTVSPFIKISKTPLENGVHQVVVPPWAKDTPVTLKLKEMLGDISLTMVEKESEGIDYIPLLDLALLRPFTKVEDLTAEEGHVGSNPPPLQDKPQEGSNPLSETKEMKTELAQPSSEQPTTASAPEIQPLNLENLIADLEQLLAFLHGKTETHLNPHDEVHGNLGAVEKDDVSVVFAKSEAAISNETPPPTPVTIPPTIAPPPPPLPPVETPAPLLPSPPITAPMVPPTPGKKLIETRGQSASTGPSSTDLDLAAIYKLSWADIHSARSENENRKR